MLGAGLLVCLLAWFAPSLLMHSPWRPHLLRAATGGLPGPVTIEHISVGWLSPVVLGNVAVADAAGEPLITLDTVRTQRSLLELAWSRGQLGRIRVHRPVVHVILHGGTSNLETYVQTWLASSGEASGIRAQIELVDGRMIIRRRDAAEQWVVDPFQVRFELPAAEQPGQIEFETELTSAGGAAGRLAGTASWNTGATPRVAIDLRANGAPLEFCQPWLRRWDPGLEIAGKVEGALQLEFGAGASRVEASGWSVTDVHLRAPQYVGARPLNAQNVNLDGTLAWSGGTWQADQLNLRSDILQFEMHGSGPAMTGHAPLAAATEALRHGAYQLAGQASLPRLAEWLPEGFQLRRGTELQTGTVRFAFSSTPGADEHLWTGTISAEELGAVHGEKKLVWKRPLDVGFQIRRSAGGLAIEQLTCASSFLNAQATGSPAQGQLVAHGDLHQLGRELAQFLELGEKRLGGSFQANLRWEQRDNAELAVNGRMEAREFQFMVNADEGWREPLVTVQLDSLAELDGGRIRRLTAAQLDVRAAQDAFLLELTQPVEHPVTQRRFPLAVEWKGSLRAWQQRLTALVVFPDLQLDGQVDLHAAGTVAPDSVEVRELRGRLKDAVIASRVISIDEPLVEFAGKGRWESAREALEIEDLTFTSSVMAFRAQSVRSARTNEGFRRSGAVGFRLDLAKLCGLLPEQVATSSRIGGEATGTLRLDGSPGTVRLDADATVQDFVFERRSTGSPVQGGVWRPVWREPQLRMAALGRHDMASGTMTFDELEVDTAAFRFGGAGQLADLQNRGLLQLDGEVTYDLAPLVERFRPQLGPRIELAGRGTQAFAFRGPLFSPPTAPAMHTASLDARPAQATRSTLSQYEVRGALDWQAARIHGVEMGPGKLQSELADGRLNIEPSKLSVSGGHVHVAGQIDLNSEPAVWQLPPGPLVERVQLSREMCQGWLKYVAPVVADVTAAEGTFSLALDEAAVPLPNPQQGTVQGRFVVHQAAIGPGPLTREFLWLAEQVRAIIERRPFAPSRSQNNHWLLLPEQQFDFRLDDQRVHHQELRMKVHDVIIRTRGSVGLDQSLALTAEIPVRDEWLEQAPYLSVLRGQVVRIPIGGTLSRPQFDRRALAELSRVFLNNAGSRLLQEGLNRGLNRLLGPPQ